MSETEDSNQKVSVRSLRKGLQRFNEDLGKLMNDDARYKLGRVLTVIDAAFSDPEQRKAVKDLVQNNWWGGGDTKAAYDGMGDPHHDLRKLCEALGFDLYDESGSVPASVASESRYNRYDEILGNASSNR